MKRILFICKERIDSYGVPVGLINSAQFTTNALNDIHAVHAKAVTVKDNSDIWSEINKFKPTHVIIDALWVVPSKFYELLPLYPNVKFIVRSHSKTSFLATEGIAFSWFYQYNSIQKEYKNFTIATNSKDLTKELNSICIKNLFLPNIYCPETKIKRTKQKCPNFVDISSFGAIRPLKNQLLQALASIQYANAEGKRLRFHMNTNRVEQNGSEVYQNIRALFDNNYPHTLHEHPWLPHREFIQLITSQIDVGLQVSYSESFNIVAADFAYNRVPIVGSKDISWLPSSAKADPNSTDEIREKISCAYQMDFLVLGNERALRMYNKTSTKQWMCYLNDQY